MRDAEAAAVQYLRALPGAASRLRLVEADVLGGGAAGAGMIKTARVHIPLHTMDGVGSHNHGGSTAAAGFGTNATDAAES